MKLKLRLFLFVVLASIIPLFIFPSKICAQTIFSDPFDETIPTQWLASSNNSPIDCWIIKDGAYGCPLPPVITTNSYPKNWDFTKKNISYEVALIEAGEGINKNILIKYVDDNNFVGVHSNGEGTYLSGYVNGDQVVNFNYFYPKILSNGQIHNYKINVFDNKITLYIDGELIFDHLEDKIMFPNWRIGLRTSIGTETWFDNVKVTEIPTEIPLTKTVFVPGFGASWNADAFYKCVFDPDPENWSLAPYAESVYNPLLSALSQPERTVLPFYYDWRAPIISNSVALGNKLTAVTSTGEKVNIAGHSMGGLIATDYLTHQNGNTKTNSLLVVGSPLKGAAQAYPSWSGGDVWEDNFITKVAMNLYLLHCGSLIYGNRATIQSQVPSVQNLLPVFDYLKSGSKLKPWDSMMTQNDWLPLTLDSNFWGVKFGTLTGTGFSTLSQIQVKNPSKKDLLFDSQSWLDGKPARKIYSTDGDGTVLLSSSKVDDAHNMTINQTHSGLVGSVEGMAEILKFLDPNLSWTSTGTFSEPNSTLVIIGYPSNFWVSDQNGNIKKDKDGMVAFVNPKSGSYKLNLLSKSENTLLIVAQFLPTGDIKYKEYNLKGLGPKIKTLKFDLQNPQEDILIP